MTKKSNAPAIRFKGFSDAWEQRKLGDIVERVTRKNENFESALPLTISAQYGLIDQNEFFDKRIASKDVSGYYLVRKGEFAYNKSTSSDAPWGAIKRLDKYESGVLSTLYIVFQIRDESIIDSDYLVTYYDTDLWHKGVQAIAAEGARNHGLLNIAPADFFETTISMPKNIEEQRKIGAYFKSLDHLITLHQRKFEKFTNVKKSMLEKMFPQNSSNYPEIRFKGFTDVWEQRKLGDIYGTIRNAFVGTASPYYATTGHFYLESNNVKEGKINTDSQVFINDEFYYMQKDKWLHTGDMVMVQSGDVGQSAVITEEFNNSAAHALIMFQNQRLKVDPYFLNVQYQTNSAKKQIEGITKGNTIKHILSSDMQKFVVFIPSFNEQVKIGAYFKSLDQLITLHQRELEKLYNIKKSMLEKMFV